ncbi:MAG: DedA protein, partial [uncultured Nocardioidaceae bacterium]
GTARAPARAQRDPAAGPRLGLDGPQLAPRPVRDGAVLGQHGDHLRRVRVVLPLPARGHTSLRDGAVHRHRAHRPVRHGLARRRAAARPGAHDRGGDPRQHRGLRDRPCDRTTDLPARRPDHEEEVLRADRGVLRQARQQGAGHRPVRAVRAHVHHRRRRGHPDGPPAVRDLERRGRAVLGRQHHAARLLPRCGVPGPRREHRQGDPRHPRLLAHPGGLRVVAAPAYLGADGRRQRRRRHPGRGHRRQRHPVPHEPPLL